MEIPTKPSQLLLFAFISAVIGGIVAGLLVRGAFVSPYAGMGSMPPIVHPPVDHPGDCSYKITLNDESKTFTEKSVLRSQCFTETQKKMMELCKESKKKGSQIPSAEMTFGDEKPMPIPVACNQMAPPPVPTAMKPIKGVPPPAADMQGEKQSCSGEFEVVKGRKHDFSAKVASVAECTSLGQSKIQEICELLTKEKRPSVVTLNYQFANGPKTVFQSGCR
jgi:hypothetical protein